MIPHPDVCAGTGLGIVDALSPTAEGQSIAIRGPSTATSMYMASALNKIVSNALNEGMCEGVYTPLERLVRS